jgi:hypothetical protein
MKLRDEYELDTREDYDLDTEAVRALAFELWQARGCPDGSPESDWLRAEEQLREIGTSIDLVAA